jgi:hypothetical protein
LIDARFGCELIGFEQDDDGVTATYADADGEHRLRASFLVGADGSRSFVRRELGVRYEGTPDLVPACIVLIHAPGVKERTAVHESSFYFFINEHRDSAILIRQDDDDHYVFNLIPAPEGMDPDDWDDTRERLYRNLGFEVPVEKVSGGRVPIHSVIVPRFDHGRVLLAGDAAHLISPMGGFGMNLGISDAVDLGWKLGAVLNGWAGPQLIESYGAERSAVVRWIQQECIDNTQTLAPQLVEDGISIEGPDGDEVRRRVGERVVEAKSKEFGSLGAQLGYRYEGSSIVVDDGRDRPPLSMAHYAPCAAPGALAPHVWLADGVSLYDRFGLGFTLLKLGEVDTSALEAAAGEVGMPLSVLEIEHPELPGLYEARLVLIRPDQHVAWRGDVVPYDARAIIETVRGAALVQADA